MRCRTWVSRSWMTWRLEAGSHGPWTPIRHRGSFRAAWARSRGRQAKQLPCVAFPDLESARFVDGHRLDGGNRLAVDACPELVVVRCVGRKHHVVRSEERMRAHQRRSIPLDGSVTV